MYVQGLVPKSVQTDSRVALYWLCVSVPRMLAHHTQQKPCTQTVSFSQAESGYRHALEKDRESYKGTNVF